MTIRTFIVDIANAFARIVGDMQSAVLIDAGCALNLAPAVAGCGWPKHLPVPVMLNRDSGRDLTRAPFRVYAAARTGRRSC